MNQAQVHSYGLWPADGGDGDGDGDGPKEYPFVYGSDGMGEVHAQSEDPPDTSSPSQSVSVGTLAGRPTSTPQPASSAKTQTASANSNSSPPPTSTKALGVVSYAIPTINTSLLASTQIVSSAPALVHTSSPAAVTQGLVHSDAAIPHTTTAAEVPLIFSTHLSPTLPPTSTTVDPSEPPDSVQPSSTLVVISMVNPSEPHATVTHKPIPTNPISAFKHTPTFILVLILSLLVILGTLFASLSWLIRRTKRKQNDDDAWIGEVLSDEPDDSTGGRDRYGETVGRRYTNELEQGYGEKDPRAPGQRFGSGNELGEGAGRAGVGTRWNMNDEGRPTAGYGPGATTYGNETFGTTPGPAYGFRPSAQHDLAPTPNPNGFTRSHHSVLQRGAPPPSADYGYGLDGGGLTFRRDALGAGAYTTAEDIVTPNPHLQPEGYLNSQVDANANTSLQRPTPALTTSSPSHYSFKLDSTRPLAVTNLMPGDISGRTSATSLALRAGLNLNLSSSGRATSLGLPASRLDDPNPWKRYEGVEGRGGGEHAPSSAGEPGSGGWGASIKSGFYSAVGRIVGGATPGEEMRSSGRGTPISSRNMARPASITSSTSCSSKSTTNEKPKPESLDWSKWLEDRPPRHSMVPDERGWIVEEETADGARGKIHIVAGGRDRLIRHLNHDAGDAASFVSSPMTVYSSDNYSSEGPVLSSIATTRANTLATTRANTLATSRRDTVSTRRSDCRRGRGRGGDGREEDDGDGGASKMRCRELSTASSDWGSENLARALGMSMGRPVRDLERSDL
ncbi:hypothetical protein BDV93DRAFT_524199 [Ceratobasidium sp. AG-I]|nr:hypothetical protein BDV93DRAFT_524199 [Ceratobasidium sp. AG-I]